MQQPKPNCSVCVIPRSSSLSAKVSVHPIQQQYNASKETKQLKTVHHRTIFHNKQVHNVSGYMSLVSYSHPPLHTPILLCPRSCLIILVNASNRSSPEVVAPFRLMIGERTLRLVAQSLAAWRKRLAGSSDDQEVWGSDCLLALIAGISVTWLAQSCAGLPAKVPSSQVRGYFAMIEQTCLRCSPESLRW